MRRSQSAVAGFEDKERDDALKDECRTLLKLGKGHKESDMTERLILSISQGNRFFP